MRTAHFHSRDLRGGAALAAALAGRATKGVSAMVRVRNEQELLSAAVRSVAALVDEVVIIDNGSTDATPEIVRELARELPAVRSLAYPFEVAKVGRENLDAVRNGANERRHRLSSYYNWALRQCRCPFVLKWDADMVATDELAPAWEAWRSGPYLSMTFKGANVHPDGSHLLGARSGDPAVVGRGLAGDVVPPWTLQMTYTASEVRAFPRFLAKYGDGLWWCESLRTPFMLRPFGTRYRLDASAPLYLHLKFCKQSPYANHSSDFATMIKHNIAVGPALPEDSRRIVRGAFREATGPSAARQPDTDDTAR